VEVDLTGGFLFERGRNIVCGRRVGLDDPEPKEYPEAGS
jgi:hypothetical protein